MLTTPVKLSTTLRRVAPAAFNTLINGFRAYDNVPSSTFFIPSDAALSKSCSSTLAAGQARSLINAQSVKGVVAYSPALVDGAFFKAGNGEDITITVKDDGTKFANGIRILHQDVIIENGVVHIIDGVSETAGPKVIYSKANTNPQLFSAPETSCAGPPASKTVTVISTIYQQSTTVYQSGPTIYQSGPTITHATNCLPAPPTTNCPGSCPPFTTTILQGQGICPAPTTITATLTPTACVFQGPGSSCTTSVITTTTISPTACAFQVPGSSCAPVTIRTTITPPSCAATSITTTTVTGPLGPTIYQPTSCPSTRPCTPSTSIFTTTLPRQPGTITTVPITVTAPTSYITLSICPPIVQKPSISYLPEDCDEFGKPYGPNNPRPNWPNSAICSAMGGCGGPTPAVPMISTGKTLTSSSSGFTKPTSENW